MYVKLNSLSTSMLTILILTFVCSWILPVENARILAVETVGGRSHWGVVSSILRLLTANGHNVTAFTPFPDGNRENYTEGDLSNVFPKKVDMDLIDTLKIWGHPKSMIDFMRVQCRSFCDKAYGNEWLDRIIKRNESADFDLVIIETVGINCVSYLATVLNLPVIYLITSPMLTFTEHSIYGYIPNPAAISHIFANHAVPKTLVQRLSNSALLAYTMLILSYDEWIYKYTNPKPYDLLTNPVQPSLIFLNSHFISESSRPFPPNVIQIGGVHLKPVKSIPNDILEFIKNSPHGVILFTFGSTIKMSTLPKTILDAFKEALAQVPQRVLWKYEGEMENVPKNVMIRKWFPQRDILMHPNVKLFISHGGMSGVYETVDAGVPVLGFPLFYDQPKNIAHLVDAGMAKSMDLLSMTKEMFLETVLELVTNENYMKNAKIASELFKDRPMSREQSIIYWTDYVIRHKGAPHLKPHALNLTWYQYFLLDVITVLIIFVLIILFLSYKVLKITFYSILKPLLKIKIKFE